MGSGEMKNFSELLEHLREEKHISKKDLARQAKLTPGYISLLTRGEREAPSETTVKALADALNLDEQTRKDLYEAAGYSFSSTPSTEQVVPIPQEHGSAHKFEKKMDDWGEAPDVKNFYGRQRE